MADANEDASPLSFSQPTTVPPSAAIRFRLKGDLASSPSNASISSLSSSTTAASYLHAPFDPLSLSAYLEDINQRSWSLIDQKWVSSSLRAPDLDLSKVFGVNWNDFVAHPITDPYYIEQALEFKALMESKKARDFLIKKSMENFSVSNLPTGYGDTKRKCKALRKLAALFRKEMNEDSLALLLERSGWYLDVLECQGLNGWLLMPTSTHCSPQLTMLPQNPPPSKVDIELVPLLKVDIGLPPLSKVDIELPPAEQRKRLIEGIRARTSSRASQLGAPSIADLLHPAGTHADPQASKSLEVNNPNEADDDDSWMLSEVPQKGRAPFRPKKKRQGNQSKAKTVPDSLLKADDSEPERTPSSADVKPLAQLPPELSNDEAESSKVQGSKWATVVKSKPKRKDPDSQEKSTPKKKEGDSLEKSAPKKKEGDLHRKSKNRLSSAQALIKQPESSKKSKSKVDGPATTEPEFHLNHEEFPDLGSHDMTPRKKLANSTPTKTQSPQSTQPTKTEAAYDITTKAASQKASKQKTKAERKMSESRPDTVSTPTAESSTASKNMRITSSASDSGQPIFTSASGNPVPHDKRSVSAPYVSSSIHKEVPATAWSVIASRLSTPGVSKSAVDVPDAGMTDTPELARPEPSPSSSAPAKTELIKDDDSLASEKTVVPESSSKAFDYQNDADFKVNLSGFSPVALLGKSAGNFEQSYTEKGNQDHSDLPERKLTFTSDEGTVYANSMSGYNSTVPHPLVEATAKINREFVSPPGEITVNGIDAGHILGDKFPRPLTFQDHPDINLFLNSDWIVCAYCDKVLREANGDETVVCSRCGPCSLTRYCDLACLLNHLKEHWENCGEASTGVFPLDWTKLPNHYFTLIPGLGTWSENYSFERTFERHRQTTYIASAHDKPVPNIRSSYFQKLLKAGTSPTSQEVRQNMINDRSWNATQPIGEYFLFIDYEYIDRQSQLEQDGTPMGVYEFLASSILLRHRHTEGLCPSMAIPIQLEERHKIPFNRLMNACLVTNDASLVKYLWEWIRSEISDNQEIARYCHNFGFDHAALFTLWVHQFEREFGVPESAQLAMLDRQLQSTDRFTPFPDIDYMPFHQRQAQVSIVELIYKYELLHPLLRAWRRRGSNEHLIPDNPWARFRGDGWQPFSRSGVEPMRVQKPSELVWNNGWHGMPPATWQNWLNNRHVANIQAALENEKDLLDQMQSSKPRPDLFNFPRFPGWYANARIGVNNGDQWVVLRDGVQLDPLHQLESRLKTLAPEVIPETPPIGHGGKIYVRNNKFTVPASLASPKANPATTNNSVARSQLNPTVPEFRSTSPPKHSSQNNTNADMPPKPLATSANAQGWLDYTRNPLLSLERANIPATMNSIAATTPASTTDNKLLADDVYYGRWAEVKAAWINHIKEEKARQSAREQEIMDLAMEYDAAWKRLKAKQMEESQTIQANISIALAKMEEVEDEILRGGRVHLWHKIQAQKARDGLMLGGAEESGDNGAGDIISNGSSALVPYTKTTTAEAQGGGDLVAKLTAASGAIAHPQDGLATALASTGVLTAVVTVGPPPPPQMNWASIVGSKAKTDTPSSTPPSSGLAVLKKSGAVQSLTKSAATLFKPSSNKVGTSSTAKSGGGGGPSSSSAAAKPNGGAPSASTNGKDKEEQKPIGNGKDQQKPTGSTKPRNKKN